MFSAASTSHELFSLTCALARQAPLFGSGPLAVGSTWQEWVFIAQQNFAYEVRYAVDYEGRNSNPSFSTGISGSLNEETSHLGLRSIVIEPGYFRTEFLTPNNLAPSDSRIADYAEVNRKAQEILEGGCGFLEVL